MGKSGRARGQGDVVVDCSTSEITQTREGIWNIGIITGQDFGGFIEAKEETSYVKDTKIMA